MLFALCIGSCNALGWKFNVRHTLQDSISLRMRSRDARLDETANSRYDIGRLLGKQDRKSRVSETVQLITECTRQQQRILAGENVGFSHASASADELIVEESFAGLRCGETIISKLSAPASG